MLWGGSDQAIRAAAKKLKGRQNAGIGGSDALFAPWSFFMSPSYFGEKFCNQKMKGKHRFISKSAVFIAKTHEADIILWESRCSSSK